MKMLLVLVLLIAIFVLLILFKMKDSVINIKKLGDTGSLYYGEYQKDYVFWLYDFILTFFRGKAQCSAFNTFNEHNEAITARNYDMPHKDDEGHITSLNMILRLHRPGKYSSINGVDLCWLKLLKLPYYRNALDTNITLLPLAMAPYICMDGMNEKGLTASILALDLKKGEKPVYQNEKGKNKVIITQFLRMVLDDCQDVKEAIKLAQSINMINEANFDYHLFVSDAKGESVVFEWRYNKLNIVNSDAVTNFYVGNDDGEDCYYGEELKEKFVKTKLDREYHYGYGHGYQRFNDIVDKLSEHRISKDGYDTKMSEDDAWKLLGKIAQDYDGSVTSYTQYSVIYNQKTLQATFAVEQHYDDKYAFKVKD